jgi:hypothetical protein
MAKAGSVAALAAGRKAAKTRARRAFKPNRATAREADARRESSGELSLDEELGFPSIRTFGKAVFVDPNTGVKYTYNKTPDTTLGPNNVLYLFYKTRNAYDIGPNSTVTLRPIRGGRELVAHVLSLNFDKSRACTGAVVVEVTERSV